MGHHDDRAAYPLDLGENVLLNHISVGGREVGGVFVEQEKSAGVALVFKVDCDYDVEHLSLPAAQVADQRVQGDIGAEAFRVVGEAGAELAQEMLVAVQAGHLP